MTKEWGKLVLHTCIRCAEPVYLRGYGFCSISDEVYTWLVISPEDLVAEPLLSASPRLLCARGMGVAYSIAEAYTPG